MNEFKSQILRDSLFDLMIDNDETWYCWCEGCATPINDTSLLDC